MYLRMDQLWYKSGSSKGKGRMDEALYQKDD